MSVIAGGIPYPSSQCSPVGGTLLALRGANQPEWSLIAGYALQCFFWSQRSSRLPACSQRAGGYSSTELEVAQ